MILPSSVAISTKNIIKFLRTSSHVCRCLHRPRRPPAPGHHTITAVGRMRTNRLLGLVARGINTQSWQECQVAKAKKHKSKLSASSSLANKERTYRRSRIHRTLRGAKTFESDIVILVGLLRIAKRDRIDSCLECSPCAFFAYEDGGVRDVIRT